MPFLLSYGSNVRSYPSFPCHLGLALQKRGSCIAAFPVCHSSSGVDRFASHGHGIRQRQGFPLLGRMLYGAVGHPSRPFWVVPLTPVLRNCAIYLRLGIHASTTTRDILDNSTFKQQKRNEKSPEKIHESCNTIYLFVRPQSSIRIRR